MTPEVKERIEQIRHGNVPEGYKKTKSGIVPENWTEYTIGECLERVERPVDVQADEMYTQIGIRSHGKGLFYKEPVTGASLGNKAVYWVEPDCFVLNIVFAWEQAVSKTTQNEVGMIGSHRFPMYRPVDGRVDVDYLITYMLTKRGKDILEAASPGGAGRNRTLGQDRFMKSKIILPPVEEQCRIAEILTAQNKVIELKEKLLAEKQRQKKYLMQQLLSGKKRLNGFSGQWIQSKLSNISAYKASAIVANSFENFSGEKLYPIYDASGILCYVDFYLSEKPYVSIVKDGAGAGRVALAKNKSSVLGTMGYIFPTDDVFVEYLYYCLAAIDFSKYCNGSTIPHVYYKDYGCEKILLPRKEEQQAIVSVLVSSDREIELLSQDLEQEKQKKKALMQLLLTGIVRVNV